MRIENVNVYGLEDSFRASKFPMAADTSKLTGDYTERIFNLAATNKGEGHDNYLLGVVVQFDLTISNKAWVEAERYHFFDIVSSQSTMHKICLMDIDKACNKYVWQSTKNLLEINIATYNEMTKEQKASREGKELYLYILYNIPSGFELTARMTTNYRQLKTIYSQRRNHRLPDWQMVCDWIESLPYSELITGVKHGTHI